MFFAEIILLLANAVEHDHGHNRVYPAKRPVRAFVVSVVEYNYSWTICVQISCSPNIPSLAPTHIDAVDRFETNGIDRRTGVQMIAC